jgi:methionyl-tRNA synthetase
METVLYVTAEVLRIIGILVQPFIPDAADKLLTLLAIPETERGFDQLGNRLKGGVQLPQPIGIFPRYEAKA